MVRPLVALLALVTACKPSPSDSGDTDRPDSAETGGSDTAAQDSVETGDSESTQDSSETGESGETGDSDTAPPPDADGDGYTADVDCDDASPWTYPGAEEWCDPVDHDCDGAPLTDGVCGKEQSTSAVVAAYWTVDPTWTDANFAPSSFVGDLNGDGADDVIARCYLCAFDRDGVDVQNTSTVIWGGPMEHETYVDFDTTTWFYPPADSAGLDVPGLSPVGDFDGDGFADVAFINSDGGEGGGHLWLVQGPLDRFGPQTWVNDAASATWSISTWSEFGNEGYAAGNLNGDGLPDLLVGAPGIWSGYYAGVSGGVYILDGRSTLEDHPSLADEGFVHDEGDCCLGDGVTVLGDADGDGLSDWAAWNSGTDPWTVSVFLGATPLSGRVAASDVQEASLTLAGPGGSLLPLGDLDGDGRDDWGVSSHTDNHYGTDAGGLWVLGEPPWSEESIEANAKGGWAGSARDEVWAEAAWNIDDAERRTVAWADADGEYLSPLDGLPAPDSPPPTARLSFGAHAGITPTMHGDFDGDGWEEFYGGGYPAPDAPDAAGGLIQGWAIPFDQPAWW